VTAVVPGLVSVVGAREVASSVVTKVDSATVCSVKVNVLVEVVWNVKLPLVVLKVDLEMLCPPVIVDPGIVEVSVDVTKMVSILVIVVSGWVMVTSTGEKLTVNLLVLVDAGRVVVNVVMRVSTIEHPEGTIDGPAGKHAPKPGYWDEYALLAIRKSRTVCGTYP